MARDLDSEGRSKLYSTPSRGADLLLAGLALFCLGGIVVWFSVVEAGLRGDRELLLAIGSVLALAGLFVAWLGARPRRHWVRSDERGLSQPWAFGKPQVDWDDMVEMGLTMSGGVWVSPRSGGPRLRIARELESYEQLIDEICDQLTINRGVPTEGLWKRRFGLGAVRLTDSTLDISTPRGTEQVALRDIRAAAIELDGRLSPTTVLLLKSGSRVLVPYLGSKPTLVLYRALRLRPQ